MDILQQMLKRAQANPQRIVLPEGDEPRTLEAANLLLKDKVAKLPYWLSCCHSSDGSGEEL